MIIIDFIVIHIQVVLTMMIGSGKAISISEEQRRLQSIYIQWQTQPHIHTTVSYSLVLGSSTNLVCPENQPISHASLQAQTCGQCRGSRLLTTT